MTGVVMQIKSPIGGSASKDVAGDERFDELRRRLEEAFKDLPQDVVLGEIDEAIRAERLSFNSAKASELTETIETPSG